MTLTMEPQQNLDRLGRELLGAIRHAIESVPGAPQRPHRFSQEFGINKDVSSRLFAAMRSRDVFTAMHRMPGSAAIRQVLDVVGARGGEHGLVQVAHSALASYDDFIREQFQDRAGLDAFIGASLPHARRRAVAAAKHSIYRGNIVLRGVASDATLSTFITYPSAGTDNRVCDLAVINGFIGLRRVRPGVPIAFAHVSNTADHSEKSDPMPGGHVLEDFCSPPSLPFSVRRENKSAHYILPDRGVGPNSAVDLFTLDIFPRNYSCGRTLSLPGRKYFYATADYPSRILIFDMFVRDDLWPTLAPSLLVYDTDKRGVASVNNPERDSDRVDTDESIESLGAGPVKFRSAEIPRYDEMLSSVFARLKQDPGRFRCYRCQIAYPVRSWQVCMVFEPAMEGAQTPATEHQ